MGTSRARSARPVIQRPERVHQAEALADGHRARERRDQPAAVDLVGNIFISALKAVAPVLMLLLVAAAIAAQGRQSDALDIPTALRLRLVASLAGAGVPGVASGSLLLVRWPAACSASRPMWRCRR